jgi:hypothetical protein
LGDTLIYLGTTYKSTTWTPSQDNDLQNIFSTHDGVFMDIPPGIPPHRGFEHTIELETGAKPVITTPYCHPRKLKDEIGKTI